METDLYYHRCFVRTNYRPKILKYEPTITTVAIQLFVEEAIAYVFSFGGIDGWAPLTSIAERKSLSPNQVYFHGYIGLAINHQCVVDDVYRWVEEDGFEASQWLQLSTLEAREEVQRYIELIRAKAHPLNLTMIYLLAFAGVFCKIAMQRRRADLVEVVIWRTIGVLKKRFPLEWIYYDVKHWAIAYNVRHFEIHNKLIMEDPFEESKPVYTQFEYD